MRKLEILAKNAEENGKTQHSQKCYSEINKMLGYKDLPLKRLFNLNDFDTLTEKQAAINDAYSDGVISLDEFKAFTDSIKSVELTILADKVKEMSEEMSDDKEKEELL